MFTSWKDCPTFGLLLFVMLTSQSQGQFVPDSRCLETCRLFQNEKFNNYCPKEGTCDWQCAAQRMNCLGQEQYHCAREYGQQKFVNVCAIPQQCSIGKEPAISFTTNRKQVPNTQVICIACVDKSFYNDIDNRTSSTFSQCLYKKNNHCTKENHKIDCGPERRKQAWDVQTEGDGFCRCDARDGYEPKFKDVLVTEGEYCFDRKVECVKKDCEPGMELSLNYACIPKCAEGLVRTQLSDMCLQLEISSSPTTHVSVLPSFTANRTETLTMSPNPQNSTMGPSPHPGYVIALCIIFAAIILIAILVSVFIYKRNVCKKKEDHIKGETTQHISVTYKISGDLVEVKDGKVTFNKYGEAKKIGLSGRTGTASNQRSEREDLLPRPCKSSSVPDFKKDHHSSQISLQSCTSAAGTLPSPTILSKEGLDLELGVSTFECHPSDELETMPGDMDTLPDRILGGINEEEFKPVHVRPGPDVDGDVTYVDEGVISNEKMEELAKELLNNLNGYLKIFIALNETNLATIKSNLKKKAAENKVNLDTMFNFRICVGERPTRCKDVFTCKNCGMKFIRSKSSGNNNSCMYQSISTILSGGEHLQNRLRLCSTLHAIKHFKGYVKQLEAFVGNEQSPYNRVLEIFAAADIDTSGIKDWKLCLTEGIRKIVVETSESTRDSSQLHIMFLSHALRCKITQHFEDSTHHKDTEDCPVFEEDTASTSDVLDLHILWNKECNHLMPLFQ